MTATKPAPEQARKSWPWIGIALAVVVVAGAFALGMRFERWTDGDMFAFINAIDGDSITIDPAAMLTGDAAREAAERDGLITAGEDLPNDFYIQNNEPGPLSIGVAPGIAVTILTFDSTGDIIATEIGLAQLATAFSGESTGVVIYGLNAGEFPVTLTVEDNVVTAISQVYLP
ncbi:MAG TPA: hypothetical protein VLB85_13765 [Acidimicrobiia bacterium]|nr:hypothetical protein [Acidimicrobiia bacterium]